MNPTKYSNTKTQLLINTCLRFNLHTRAMLHGDECCYWNDKGQRCAIGIEVPEYKARYLQHTYGSSSPKDVEEDLPKRLTNLSTDYLNTIQLFHDASNNWNPWGLSERGFKRAMWIAIDFKLKLPKVQKCLDYLKNQQL
jgi:hypothetical protein